MAVFTYKSADVRLFDVGLDPDIDGRMTLNAGDVKLRSSAQIYNLSHLGISLVKASDETVNNSAVLQDDDDLSFIAPANTTWALELYLIYNSSAIADINFGWTVPAGATMSWKPTHVSVGTELTESEETNAAGNAANSRVGLQGRVTIGGTGGAVQLRWSQDVAEVSNTILRAGSWMNAIRLA